MAYRTYEKRLKELALFHLGKRRLWRNQIAVFPYLNRPCREGDRIFSEMCQKRTRSNSHKVQQERFQLDIRHEFFSAGVVACWCRLPRGCGTSTLEVFKT